MEMLSVCVIVAVLLRSTVTNLPIGESSDSGSRITSGSPYTPEFINNCRLHWYIPGCTISALFDGYELTANQSKTAELWLSEYAANLNSSSRFQNERSIRLIDCLHEKHFKQNFNLFNCYADLLIDDRLGFFEHKPNDTQVDDHVISTTEAPFLAGLLEQTTEFKISSSDETDDYDYHYGITDNRPINCPPVEPMINQWYDEKPFTEQIHFCWRNPTRCPMRLTLFGLNLQRQHVDLFQQWLDYYKDNKPVDPCDDDYDEEDFPEDHDSRPELNHYMMRSMKLLTCIKDELEYEYSLLLCLRRLLEENGVPVKIAQDESFINLHKM